MKTRVRKIIKIIMIMLAILGFTTSCFIINYDLNSTPKAIMKKHMNFDIDLCVPIIESKTAAFVESKEKIYKYNCEAKDEEVRQQLTKIGANLLPTPKNINLFLYGDDTNNTKQPSAFEQVIIPKISNGYYYFIIRKDHKNVIINQNDPDSFVVDDTAITSVILYDTDSKYLYYIEFYP